jgi:hypothetical protein
VGAFNEGIGSFFGESSGLEGLRGRKLSRPLIFFASVKLSAIAVIARRATIANAATNFLESVR